MTGSYNATTSATATVTLGFQPSYIAIIGSDIINVYDSSYNPTYGYYAGSSTSVTQYIMGSSTGTNRIQSITSTGFIMNKSSKNTTMYYFAIG